jgi:dTDP-4-amino-4,6-dideoxygalactose transaminase
VRIGVNTRLDTLQAAILIEKLAIFSDEIEARDRIAKRYGEALGAHAIAPTAPEGLSSVWAQYTLRTPVSRRSAIAANLNEIGIPTALYYPKPLHLQAAYQHFPTAGNGLPVAEKIASEVLSLPMHPYLDSQVQDRIIAGFIAAVA